MDHLCLVSHGITSKMGLKFASERALELKNYSDFFESIVQHKLDSISYSQLDSCERRKSILINYDHPAQSIYREIYPLMNEFGFHGNLFVNTAVIAQAEGTSYFGTKLLTWDQIGKLMEAGWQIGNHIHTHPDFSLFSERKKLEKVILEEIDLSNQVFLKYLGIKPSVFAFTGSYFSIEAAEIISEYFNYMRVWIYDHEDYDFLKKSLEKAGGVQGGLLSSKLVVGFDLQGLIHQLDQFKEYLRFNFNLQTG